MKIHRAWVTEVAPGLGSISMRMKPEDYFVTGNIPSVRLQVTELPNKDNPMVMEKHIVLDLMTEDSLKLIYDALGYYMGRRGRAGHNFE